MGARFNDDIEAPINKARRTQEIIANKTPEAVLDILREKVGGARASLEEGAL